MFEWLRKIPHPQYGKCGGAGRDCAGKCDIKPISWMDEAFKQHDNALGRAQTKVKEDRRNADHALARALRCGDSKKLGLWGKIYRFGAMIFFKL